MSTDNIQTKVEKGFLNVCKIKFDFEGNLTPSFANQNKKFYDSENANANWTKIYFSKSSLKFTETSSNTKAGTKYIQNLEFAFPNNDKNRSLRIEEFYKIKFVILELSDKSEIAIGRNDYFQNTKPSITVKSDVNKTIVNLKFTSIFSFGYLHHLTENGYFPVDIPITFINL